MSSRVRLTLLRRRGSNIVIAPPVSTVIVMETGRDMSLAGPHPEVARAGERGDSALADGGIIFSLAGDYFLSFALPLLRLSFLSLIVKI